MIFCWDRERNFIQDNSVGFNDFFMFDECYQWSSSSRLLCQLNLLIEMTRKRGGRSE
jgi:hypothetical protein